MRKPCYRPGPVTLPPPWPAIMHWWVEVLMGENKPPGPTLTDAAEERRRRQAQALRANLARRKARDRALDSVHSPAEVKPEASDSEAVSGPKQGKTGGA